MHALWLIAAFVAAQAAPPDPSGAYQGRAWTDSLGGSEGGGPGLGQDPVFGMRDLALRSKRIVVAPARRGWSVTHHVKMAQEFTIQGTLQYIGDGRFVEWLTLPQSGQLIGTGDKMRFRSRDDPPIYLSLVWRFEAAGVARLVSNDRYEVKLGHVERYATLPPDSKRR